MLLNTRYLFCLIFSWIYLSNVVMVNASDHIKLHPKGQKLPFTHQGPFVTTEDGGILAAGEFDAYLSHDEGKTWEAYPLFQDKQKYRVRGERALLKLRDGTVVLAWMNDRERQRGGPWGKGGEKEVAKWILPVYISRSFDDGKTWTKPLKIQDRWCGAIRSLIQLKNGRLLLVAQKAIPWRHVTLTYFSNDQGKSWKSSPILDMETKSGGDHSGTMEGTVVELTDGRVYLLLRTTRGWFWEAYSSDGGSTWNDLKKSKIVSSTCCGQLGRLADGRIFLLWNRPMKDNPKNIHSREQLSMAFSNDNAQTWTKPVIVSQRPLQPGEKYYMARQSYPYLYERHPGELWITTMQGNLRMKISAEDLTNSNSQSSQ